MSKKFKRVKPLRRVSRRKRKAIRAAELLALPRYRNWYTNRFSSQRKFTAHDFSVIREYGSKSKTVDTQ